MDQYTFGKVTKHKHTRQPRVQPFPSRWPQGYKEQTRRLKQTPTRAITNKNDLKTNSSPPVKTFLLIPRRCFFCGTFLLFMFHVCHAFLPVPCSHMVTCWERANLLSPIVCGFFLVFLSLSHVLCRAVKIDIISIVYSTALGQAENIMFAF